MQQRDDGRVTKGGGVEITRITARVEDQAAEAVDRERGDVGDVRDGSEQGHREVRALDVDDGRVGQVDRSGERERALGRTRVGEGRDTLVDDLVRDRARDVVDQQPDARGESDHARAERARGHAPTAREDRTARAEHDTAGPDIEGTEGVLTAKLEQADPGLDEVDAVADEIGSDVERRGQVGVDPAGAAGQEPEAVDEHGAGGVRAQGDVAFEKARDDRGVGRGSGDRRGARELQEAFGAEGDAAESVGVADFAAGIDEREAGERITRAAGEDEAGTAEEGDVGRGMEGPGAEDAHEGVGRGIAAVDDEASGRDHDRAGVVAEDVEDALLDDRAAGVGIDGGEIDDTRAGLDETDDPARGVVGDDGVDRELAHARREGERGARRGGGTAQRDLGAVIDRDDVCADGDAGAGQGHAGSEAHGRIHGDDRRTRGGDAVDERTRTKGLARGRGERVGAEGSATVGVDRDDRGAGQQVSGVGDGLADFHAKGVDARDDGRAAGESGTSAEIRRTGGLTEEHEVVRAGGGAARGKHAADQRSADDRVEGVVAAQQATELEVEHVGGRGEDEAVGDVAVELQDSGEGLSRGEDGGRGDRAVDLGELTSAEIGVVTSETALPHHADTEHGIVGGVVRGVGDRPGAEEAARGGRRRVGEEDS